MLKEEQKILESVAENKGIYNTLIQEKMLTN